jgi:hypothetical protein
MREKDLKKIITYRIATNIPPITKIDVIKIFRIEMTLKLIVYSLIKQKPTYTTKDSVKPFDIISSSKTEYL